LRRDIALLKKMDLVRECKDGFSRNRELKLHLFHLSRSITELVVAPITAKAFIDCSIVETNYLLGSKS